MTSIIIIILLVFISYQFYQVKIMKEEQDEWEKFHDSMPHLYKKNISNKLKEQIKVFLVGTSSSESNQKWENFQELVKNEENSDLKIKMKKNLDETSKEMIEYIHKFKEEREIASQEVQFLISNYINNSIDSNFPKETLVNFNDYMLFSNFVSEDIFPFKK